MGRARAAHLGPELRRPLVLDAALPLFARDGFDAVSMQAIADAAGVSKPVLYSCYDSKEELFDELLRREERKFWHMVEDVGPGPGRAGRPRGSAAPRPGRAAARGRRGARRVSRDLPPAPRRDAHRARPRALGAAHGRGARRLDAAARPRDRAAGPHVGGLGRARLPRAARGARPWEPDALAAYLARRRDPRDPDERARPHSAAAILAATASRAASSAYFVRGQKKPRRPSLVRGTTWQCRCGTDWLTTLFMATNVPCASSASRDRDAPGAAPRAKNGRHAARRQVGQRLDVRARDQQRVALEQRPRVEERDVVVVLVDDRRGQLAGDDLAEDAVGGHRQEPRERGRPPTRRGGRDTPPAARSSTATARRRPAHDDCARRTVARSAARAATSSEGHWDSGRAAEEGATWPASCRTIEARRSPASIPQKAQMGRRVIVASGDRRSGPVPRPIVTTRR